MKISTITKRKEAHIFTTVAVGLGLVYLAENLGNAGQSMSRVSPIISCATSQPVSEEKEKKVPATTLTYKTSNFAGDSDKVLLARMLFGEARNCSPTEMRAIAYTAINRANDGKKWNGETLREAILKPYQYSCFNATDPNRKILMDPQRYNSSAFEKCLAIAGEVIDGKSKDPTNGATHYHTTVINPTWANSIKMKKVGQIKTETGKSAHKFYREN